MTGIKGMKRWLREKAQYRRVEISAGGTESPSLLSMKDHTGVKYYLWIDNLGKVRVRATLPPTSQGAQGTVVGPP